MDKPLTEAQAKTFGLLIALGTIALIALTIVFIGA